MTSQCSVVEHCSPACLTCDVLVDAFDEDSDDELEYMYENQPTPAEKGGDLVPIPWGVAQNVGHTVSNQVRARMDETRDYMMNKVYKEELYEDLMMECENREEDCSIWAAFGTSIAAQYFLVFQICFFVYSDPFKSLFFGNR
jgi:hypothetical protein